MEKTPKRTVSITIIVCPDRFGIHREAQIKDGVYVRYVILRDEDGNAQFIDDPDYETVREILFTSIGVAAWAEYHDCPFCQARGRAT